MPDSPSNYRLQDGSYKDHPWIRGLLLSPHIQDSDVEKFWQTPHKRVTVQKNEQLIDCKKDPLKIMIVTSGWLFSYSYLPNGQRKVHRLYRDGDVIGDDDFSRKKNSFDLKSASNARLIDVEVPACQSLLVSNRHLLGYLSHHLAHTLLVMLDHSTAVARLEPKARLAHFIMAMLTRVRLTSPVPNLDLLHIPLTQRAIGDYNGLTSVHVSRVLKSLTEGGYIARPSLDLIRVLDEPGLVEMSDFNDRNDDLKTKISL